MNFESLMSQLFEVLITMVGSQRHSAFMQPVVPDLIYHTIGMLAFVAQPCIAALHAHR